MSKAILYSTGCPKCKILKKKLDEKGIKYEEVNDIDTMLAMHIDAVPVLYHNDDRMEFKEAIEWANAQ